MRSRRGLGQEKHQFVAIYCRHVFRFSYFWQDMRAMYPKSPAKRRWGIRRANILPPRGVFAARSPQIMHGAQILPPSDGLGPCAGVPTPPSAPPIPATCQCLPLAAPITVRDKPPMNFGGDHSAHGLQFGQAPRGRRSGVPGWPSAPAPRGPGGCCHRGRSPLRTTDRKLPGPEATAR